MKENKLAQIIVKLGRVQANKSIKQKVLQYHSRSSYSNELSIKRKE